MGKTCEKHQHFNLVFTYLKYFIIFHMMTVTTGRLMLVYVVTLRLLLLQKSKRVDRNLEFQQSFRQHFARRQAVLPETSQTRSYLGVQQAFSAQGLSQMERRWWHGYPTSELKGFCSHFELPKLLSKLLDDFGGFWNPQWFTGQICLLSKLRRARGDLDPIGISGGAHWVGNSPPIRSISFQTSAEEIDKPSQTHP